MDNFDTEKTEIVDFINQYFDSQIPQGARDYFNHTIPNSENVSIETLKKFLEDIKRDIEMKGIHKDDLVDTEWGQADEYLSLLKNVPTGGKLRKTRKTKLRKTRKTKRRPIKIMRRK